MAEHNLTAHTISTKYSDGSVSKITIKTDEESILIEKGSQWISIPHDVAEMVMDAMGDLLHVQEKP